MLAVLCRKSILNGGTPLPLPHITLSPEYSFPYPLAKPGPFSDPSKKH